MTSALQGIRILDLSRLPPGNYATMILGDLGADVLRIEAPGVELPVRKMRVNKETWLAYDAHQRNKRSMILNLRTAEARAIFYKLVQDADVVAESFRPGVTRRLEVDYETVSKVNPRIVYCSLTGYGQEGPYHKLAGHDINYIAIAGALDMVGHLSECPTIPPSLVADYAGGGMHAAIGILAALIARQRTGKGQYVDISMADGVISLLAMEASRYFAEGRIPKRGETVLTGASPYYNTYRTKDGKCISVGCIESKFWASLCRALGQDDLIPYQSAKGKKRKEIFSRLAKIFLTKTRDEWFQFLKQSGICIAPVYSLDEVFQDPQVIQRQMVVEIEHPKLGKVKQVGISTKLSDTPGCVRSLGVLPGKHTREVLASLGYTQTDVDKLYQAGVIS